MSRLTTDIFVRRMAQIFLILGLLFLIASQFSFLYVTVNHLFLVNENQKDVQRLTISLLKFPFEQNFSSLFAIMAGTIPILFSTTCFSVGTDGKPTENLNRIGHAVLTILVFGTLAGLLGIMILGIYGDHSVRIYDILGTDDEKEAKSIIILIRSTISSILAFELFYVAQLIGVKK